MDLAQALLELGLGNEQPLTAEAARRAYMRQVRTHPPERDPQGFQRVRHAYEVVQQHVNRLQFTRQPDPLVHPSPNTAPDNAAAPPEEPEPEHEPGPDREPHPRVEETTAERTANLLWREYEIALTSSQTAAVNVALLALYTQPTPITRIPPPQIAFRTVLELFRTGRRDAARQLLAAFESDVDRRGGLHLGSELAANWQVLRELDALSKVVKKRLTRALAAAVASGNLDDAGVEIALERDRQGGKRLATSMKELAPSLYAAMPFGAAESRPVRKSARWQRSGTVTLLLVGLRLFGALFANHNDDEPTAYPAHVARVAHADPPPALPATVEPPPSAAPPRVEAGTLSGSALMTLRDLSANVEKQYLAGQCDEVRGTWPKYAWEIRRHAHDAPTLQAYSYQRNRAVAACPDLAAELAEQP